MNGTYELLDSGEGRKLERVGPWVLDRQAPQAFWARTLPALEWQRADALHHRSPDGGGHWEFRRDLPEQWEITFRGLRLLVRPTPFGHIGLFPEHAAHWEHLALRVREHAQAAGRPAEVLNLFAYTGGATLALCRAGAHVCHVDASRGSVDQARQQAALNGLSDAPVRWIVDDCLAFLARERRRDREYDAVILDPPSYGRGSRKQIFRLEDDVIPLLEACRAVLRPEPLLALLSAHTPGFTPIVLGNLLTGVFPGLQVDSGESVVQERAGTRPLPSGAWALASRPG